MAPVVVFIMLIILFFTQLLFADENRDILIEGCRVAAKITRSELKYNTDAKINRVLLGCENEVFKNKKIREDYKKEENKEAFACGLGIRVAAEFYKRTDILKNNDALVIIYDKCANELNSTKIK